MIRGTKLLLFFALSSTVFGSFFCKVPPFRWVFCMSGLTSANRVINLIISAACANPPVRKDGSLQRSFFRSKSSRCVAETARKRSRRVGTTKEKDHRSLFCVEKSIFVTESAL